MSSGPSPVGAAQAYGGAEVVIADSELAVTTSNVDVDAFCGWCGVCKDNRVRIPVNISGQLAAKIKFNVICAPASTFAYTVTTRLEKIMRPRGDV